MDSGDLTKLAVGILGVASAAIGLIAAFVGRRKVVITRQEVVHRHETPAQAGGGLPGLLRSVMLCVSGFGLLCFLVLVAKYVSSIQPPPAIKKGSGDKEDSGDSWSDVPFLTHDDLVRILTANLWEGTYYRSQVDREPAEKILGGDPHRGEFTFAVDGTFRVAPKGGGRYWTSVVVKNDPHLLLNLRSKDVLLAFYGGRSLDEIYTLPVIKRNGTSVRLDLYVAHDYSLRNDGSYSAINSLDGFRGLRELQKQVKSGEAKVLASFLSKQQ